MPMHTGEPAAPSAASNRSAACPARFGANVVGIVGDTVAGRRRRALQARRPVADRIPMMHDAPSHLELERSRGLTVHWPDGTRSFYPISFLRRMSPSADARALREQMARNPLTVLPSGDGRALAAVDAELVGNYAIRIRFSDGHDTGLYSWDYLREIDPATPERPS